MTDDPQFALYENVGDLTVIEIQYQVSGVSPGTVIDDSATVLFMPKTRRRAILSDCFCCCEFLQMDPAKTRCSLDCLSKDFWYVSACRLDI
jgi:hypothetical protein